MRLRDQREVKATKKAFTPANRRMKAFRRTPGRTRGWAGLILLFDGEVVPDRRDLTSAVEAVS